MSLGHKLKLGVIALSASLMVLHLAHRGMATVIAGVGDVLRLATVDGMAVADHSVVNVDTEMSTT